MLILNPKKTKVIVYSSMMVDKVKKAVFASRFSTLSNQLSKDLFDALKTDQSPLANQLIEDLHDQKKHTLAFDLLEYLIFVYCLSGFDVFWASKTIKSYGYPNYPRRLGEICYYLPSSVYSLKKIEFDSSANFLKKIITSLTGGDCDYKDLKPILEGNKIMEHFMGETSLNQIETPHNFLLVLPKGSEISIDRDSMETQRIIKISNRYATINFKIIKFGTSLGLPHPVKIKEKDYDEHRYSTTNFTIEVSVSTSKLFSILPRIEHYYAWTNRIIKKLVANFAYSRKGIIEEIEVP